MSFKALMGFDPNAACSILRISNKRWEYYSSGIINKGFRVT